MPTPELRALLLLVSLAVAGQGVRYLVTKPGDPPGGVNLLATSRAESPLAQRDSAMRQARPLAAGEQIDVDIATAAELTRLPKVGPRLAKTIVSNRLAEGPFASLDGLDRVAGIGPALLNTLRPHVVFSGTIRPQAAGSETSRLNLNTASSAELDVLPGIGPAKAQAIVRYREEHGLFTAVEGLTSVPGLSRAAVARLAGRVVVR
jgi:competence protein ComEA